MTSMYEEYIKEREFLKIIKTDKGFITYRVNGDTCLINDYFVLPEFRKNGHGYFLANSVFEICKEIGINKVECRTDNRANGYALSKFTIENFGFELTKEENEIGFYEMEVSLWEKR